MIQNTIQSQDLTLKAMFQDFYRVPDYQREYVWGEKDAKGERGDEVDQFLTDIFTEFDGQPVGTAPEYFIGTVVVCPGPGGVRDLIDGQQRTTTAYLTLCAIRDRLKELMADVPNDLEQRIAATDTDEAGETIFRYRLDLQYDDSGGVLKEYGAGRGLEAPSDGTRSIRNIANAYQAIRTFLNSNFQEDPDAVRRFYGYFTNKVKLIRIETPDVARALKIFETINDRGVGLDAMDLLKNLLFMNATPADYSKLKDIWKQLADVIYNAGEKPLRFLRQFILATYDADQTVREDAIYGWLLKNKAEVGFATDPLGFANRLLSAAQALAMFVAGNSPKGLAEPGIINTRFLGGRAARQHHVVLLAGRGLSPTIFSRLASDVESLMALYLIGKVAAKDYERAIVYGAQQLRFVKTDAEYDAFVVGFFDREKEKHADAFRDAFLSLRLGAVQTYRLRYVLAKLTQYIDVQAYGEVGSHGSLDTYIGEPYEIEHILPDQPSDEALSEIVTAERANSGEGQAAQAGQERPDIPPTPEEILAVATDVAATKVSQQLGNLVLLERAINRSIKNAAYSKKAVAYKQSQLLVTKSIAALPQVGRNDQITRAVAILKVFPTWPRKAIAERQTFLADLAIKVWRLAG